LANLEPDPAGETIPLAAIARTLFATALADCSVHAALSAKLVYRSTDHPFRFTLNAPSGLPLEVDLCDVDRILVVAAGKAAATTLASLRSLLRVTPACRWEGVLIAPEPLVELPPGIAYFAGGHPLPNAESFAGAQAALAMIESAVADSRSRPFCFFLLSGGASAMMELPLDPTIPLEDAAAFHRALVHSGASIADINCVRKHFSAIKGGRLGLAAAAIPNLTMLVSDVPSGDLDALASGPTLPDRSTLAQCHEVLARYRLIEQFPVSVRSFFTSPQLPETPKPAELHPRTFVLLSAADLARSASAHAELLGFYTVVDNTCDDWDYCRAAEYLLGKIRGLRQHHPRVCLVSAGEVTVKVSGETHGRGGRNQHLALYAATMIDPQDCPIAILSGGSDGIDGNSPAAGAVVDCHTLTMGSPIKLWSEDALLCFDSHTCLDQVGATIVTGPTGNNLRDLRILVATQHTSAKTNG
jgi:glycerate 2-kinase